MSGKKSWYRIVQVILILLLVGLDQVTKWLAEVNHMVVMNYGGIFGLLPGFWWKGGLVLVLVWMIYEWMKSDKLKVQLGLVLILAGGLGNVWDRLAYGGVRDFIYYPVLNVYGNVADIYLAMGVVWLGWLYLKDSKKKEKNIDE